MAYKQDHLVLNNGYKMPIVGFGTWQATGEEVESAVNAALEAGYRHIDTAYVYENEPAIGRTLKKWFDSGRIKREDVFIVTKLPNVGNRAESVEKYIKRSLAALQLDYLDLYLIHSPVGAIERNDEVRPSDENGILLTEPNTDHITLWKAMEAQVDAGRTKSIGLSNFNARQIKRIVKSARIPPANLQVELNVYFQQRELVAFCNALDITVCAYAPLGSPGFPAFMTRAGQDMSKVQFPSPLNDQVVLKISKKYNKTPAQVLLRHITQRAVAVIPKSSNPTRIKENFQVLDFTLSAEDVYELDALDRRSKGRVFGRALFLGSVEHAEDPFNDPY